MCTLHYGKPDKQFHTSDKTIFKDSFNLIYVELVYGMNSLRHSVKLMPLLEPYRRNIYTLFIHTQTHTHTYIHIHTHIHTYTHTHTHTHIYIYIYIYIYTHTSATVV